MLGLSVLQLTLVGAAVAAVGTVAGAVLVTSGPLANDGDNGSAAQAATVTTESTTTITSPDSPETPTAPSETPVATPTATVEVDADGWPAVKCEGGLEPVQSPTRRITVCAPVEAFVLTPWEREDTGYMLHQLLWTHSESFDYFISLQVVAKDGSVGTRGTSQADCKTDEPSGSATFTSTTLLGHEAEQCVWRSRDQSKPVIGNQVWGVEQFAELPDYWIIANATGPQVGGEADAALELALRMFASARAAGLERQP